ncbi:alpha/beta-hydrolase [Neoconidiobolus thromboides FSU 785]|nr:alpha/beta-hydrolase [Neoconidiobolus thromboides FSU 785]
MRLFILFISFSTFIINVTLCFKQVNFKTQTQSLNETLRLSAYFANAAYCPKWLLLKWKCGKPCSTITKGFRLIKYYEDWLLGSSAYIGEIGNKNKKEKQLVIAFRGTQNFQGIMVDLVGSKLDYSFENSKVHYGFLKAYDRLKKPMLLKLTELLTSEEYKDASILIVGHSLGGALGTFMGLDLKLNLKMNNTITINTFGAPRIGDFNFAKLVTKTFKNNDNDNNKYSLLRVANTDDIITHLPLSKNGFYHNPHEILLFNNNTWKECNDLSLDPINGFEDPDCLNTSKNLNLYSHLAYFDLTFGLECTL